jgi:type III restriction enzyme
MRREVQRLFPGHADRQRSPINLCDIEDPRFDALIEYNSRAAEHIREQARKIVDGYIEHSTIVQNALDRPYEPGSVLVEEAKMVRFRNALHEGYSDLNIFERTFAEGLDRTRRVWCRNPSQGGFSIPLLDRGSTRSFRPDFLVWVDNYVIAIDPKGDHLINEDAGRKVFSINKMEEGPELVIRLVTEGRWQSSPTGLFGKISGTATPSGCCGRGGRTGSIARTSRRQSMCACEPRKPRPRAESPGATQVFVCPLGTADAG